MRSSPEAKHTVTCGGASKNHFVASRILTCMIVCLLWSLGSAWGQAQDSSQQSATASTAAQSEINQNTAEVASHDAPTTFKVNVKLVVVRAVVRDAQGHAVGN